MIFIIKKLLLPLIFAFVAIAAVSGYAFYRYTHKPKPVIKPLEEISIRFIEGWQNSDYASYLDKNQVVTKADFNSSLATLDRSQYRFLGTVPKNSDLEGFLFPDTYRVLKDATSKDIIKKLLDNFGKKLSTTEFGVQDNYLITGYQNLKSTKTPGGMSLYEVVTLASILEKETGTDLSKKGADQTERLIPERRTVAGIFLNRLTVGKALESDATINYITGKDKASPDLTDLEKNSPYNTYKYPGLPPGPICNPSLMSIEAVLNPIKTDYFYFLHKQPSGEVVYSKTFEEHVNNKFKYLK